MRSQTLPFSLATLLLLLTAPYSALAEPPWQVPYVNAATGQCGLFWDGLEGEERTPLDGSFAELSLPRHPEPCKKLLDQVLAYQEQLRTPFTDRSGEAATKPPCEQLALSLPNSVEHACKALGYRYVGELPASIIPCYPNLGPFLGAKCAPFIWIHLAVLVVVLAFLGAVVYVILRRWRQRRRAMAAAAEDAPAPPSAPN